MIAKLESVYKGIREHKAGSFTNEKGNVINFKDFYTIRFDQILSGLPKETEAKIDKTLALNVAKNFNIYDKIIISFNILYYNSRHIIITINNIEKI